MSSLDKYIKEETLSLESRLNMVKQKLIKKGNTEVVALRKAEVIVFKPNELEKRDLNAQQNIGLRPHLKFFFDDKEDLKLVAKYFNVSFTQMAVKDSKPLLMILKMLEEIV